MINFIKIKLYCSLHNNDLDIMKIKLPLKCPGCRIKNNNICQAAHSNYQLIVNRNHKILKINPVKLTNSEMEAFMYNHDFNHEDHFSTFLCFGFLKGESK